MAKAQRASFSRFFRQRGFNIESFHYYNTCCVEAIHACCKCSAKWQPAASEQTQMSQTNKQTNQRTTIPTGRGTASDNNYSLHETLRHAVSSLSESL